MYSTPCLFGPESTGSQLRDSALAAHNANSPHLLLLARRAILIRLLAGQPTVCADDVRADVALPPGKHPSTFGAAPGPLARLGIIAKAGAENTTRRLGHARPITKWILVDAEKARRWLAANPDPHAANEVEL
jgi:hypothetical protein